MRSLPSAQAIVCVPSCSSMIVHSLNITGIAISPNLITGHVLQSHIMKTSDQSPLLKIIFVDDRGGFGQLAAFLEEPFDVFANEVGFEIDGIVDLLEA